MNKWHYGYKADLDKQVGIMDDETGRTVAVAYDGHDAPLIAAAPALLMAAERVLECWASGDLAGAVRELDQAARDAKGSNA